MIECVSVNQTLYVPKDDRDFQGTLQDRFQKHRVYNYSILSVGQMFFTIRRMRAFDENDHEAYRLNLSAHNPETIIRYVDMNPVVIDAQVFLATGLYAHMLCRDIELGFCGSIQEEEEMTSNLDNRFGRTIPAIPCWEFNSKNAVEFVLCIPEQKRERERFMMSATIEHVDSKKMRIAPPFVSKAIEGLTHILNKKAPEMAVQ